VASLDGSGGFYFISPRDYDETRNTLWRAEFDAGRVRDARPLPGTLAPNPLLRLNMDAEISADGERLYFTDNRWRLFGGGIASSNLALAAKDAEGAFHRVPGSQRLFAAVNTDRLEFAPALTEDELTLYFTRVDRDALRRGAPGGFAIFVSTRPSTRDPFAPPRRIEAISGYVEGPTVAPDGCTLYFHQRVQERFVIRAATRSDCASGR